MQKDIVKETRKKIGQKENHAKLLYVILITQGLCHET